MYGESLICSLEDAKMEHEYWESHFKYKNFESPFKEGCKFLDVGCGEGHFMKYLESKGIKTHGIDFNDVSPYKDLKIAFGDFHTIPFEDNSFDLVWSYGIYCSRYSNDSDKIINESLMVMKKGGYYLIKDADIPSNLNNFKNSEIVFRTNSLAILQKTS